MFYIFFWFYDKKKPHSCIILSHSFSLTLLSRSHFLSLTASLSLSLSIFPDSIKMFHPFNFSRHKHLFPSHSKLRGTPSRTPAPKHHLPHPSPQAIPYLCPLCVCVCARVCACTSHPTPALALNTNSFRRRQHPC